MIKNKYLFYFLSFTWGFPMTLIGLIAVAILYAIGYKPKKWGYCYHFEVGENWGGVSFGPIFITCKNAPERTRNHEHGHSQQNCIWGLAFPFAIGLPSLTRYWYRVWYNKHEYPKTKKPLPDYDSVWYEGGASKIGTEFMNWYNNNTK